MRHIAFSVNLGKYLLGNL